MSSPDRPADIWNEQKGDRMLSLRQRMVRAVLMLFSAIRTILVPGKVVLRPIPVEKSQSRAMWRRR